MGGLGPLELIVIFFLAVIALGLYFLPTIIAVARGHANLIGIGLVNFFLGWSLLGWIGALVWAVYRREREV